ncbi:MAG: bifunctional precorrin-2 dehydrogenase/sirohydrochlorin ferrochelatase [Thermoproteota archaeon]|nr:bifunctional precorrin-2 dehydrogenase/sirohydrochlorin ferrochelatase [Thermoproteota archaeon]
MIIDLNLDKKNILIIGGGTEGYRKVKSLLNHNCNITVVSEHINHLLYEYIKKENHNLKLIKKKVDNAAILAEFDNLFIVFAATNNRLLNKDIITKAKESGIIAYSIDDPSESDFSFMSTINIDGLIQIAVSTSGKSPIMTKIIRDRLENAIKDIIGKNDIHNINIQEFARSQAKLYIERPEDRKHFLYSLINNPEIQGLINENKIDKVKERIINTLDKWRDNKVR